MLLMASEGTWDVGSKKSVESKKIWRNIWWNKPFEAGAMHCVHLKIRGHLDAKSSRKNWRRWMLMWKLRASFFQGTLLGDWNDYFQGWKRNLHLGDQFRSLGRSWRWSLSCDSCLANVSWSRKNTPFWDPQSCHWLSWNDEFEPEKPDPRRFIYFIHHLRNLIYFVVLFSTHFKKNFAY